MLKLYNFTCYTISIKRPVYRSNGLFRFSQTDLLDTTKERKRGISLFFHVVVFPRRLDYYVSPRKLPSVLIDVAETKTLFLSYIKRLFYSYRKRADRILESLSIVIRVSISTETSYIAVIRTRGSYPYGTSGLGWMARCLFSSCVVENISSLR